MTSLLAFLLFLATLYIIVQDIRLLRLRRRLREERMQTLKKSQRQERAAAKRYGGQVNPGSGNGWVHKNDVRTDVLSIEAKYTDKKQYTLKLDDLHTAEKIALVDGRDVIFLISFSGEEFCVVREADYRDLYERVNGGQQPS